MRRTISLLSLSVIAGCSVPNDAEDVGAASAALGVVPSGVNCVRIDVASGSRTVTRSFDVVAGHGAKLGLDRLPVGSVSFVGSAYAQACTAVAASSTPTWLSDPTAATLTPASVAPVSLVLHMNGEAAVEVSFDGGGDGGVIPPAKLPSFVDIVVDRLDPTTPVEGRPVTVYFTATNDTLSAQRGRFGGAVTAGGVVTPTSSWSINALQVGSVARGVLTFTAPPALAQDMLEVYFEQVTTLQHIGAVSAGFATAARYTFAIDTVKIDNPRSLDTDTDYLVLSGAVNGSLAFDRWLFLGNGGSGKTYSGLTSSTVDVVPDPATSVAVGAFAMNWGNNAAPTNAQLNAIGSAFALDGNASVDFSSINWFTPFFPINALFNCDGVVAEERRVWSGRQLHDLTAAPSADPTVLGTYADSHHYPGFVSGPTCGAVSNYDMAWSIQRRGVAYDRLVTVSPTLRTVAGPGGIALFTASEPVDWSVDGSGTIDSAGKFTASGALTQLGFATVRATARDGSGRSGVGFATQGITLVKPGGF